MTVGELQARMGHAEVLEWQAYFGSEPFATERADAQVGLLATLAAIMANANRDTKKRLSPYKPEEFLPDYRPAPVQATTGASLRAKFMAMMGNQAQANDDNAG